MRHIQSCPICGEKPTVVIEADAKARERFLAYSQKKYAGLMDDWLDDMELAIDRCSECGHHWYRYQPESNNLSLMYENGQPLSVISPSREPTALMVKEMTRLRSLVKKDNPTLLDYGSGFGRWARAAAIAGFDVSAYEPSRERGKEDTLTNFTWIHDKAEISASRFDVINVEQVLEHVPMPVETMREIHNYCKFDSIVRVTVPNLDRSREKERIWEVWPFDGSVPHFMAPFEHLHGFTSKSLNTLSFQAGFLPMPATLKTFLTAPIYYLRKRLGSYFPFLSQTKLYLIPGIVWDLEKVINK